MQKFFDRRHCEGDRVEVSMPIPTRITGTMRSRRCHRQKTTRGGESNSELAARNSARLGMDRREFLKTACGMATAFMAMNAVYGPLFSVDPAEAANPDAAAERGKTLAGQFIFDVQTHFVSGAYEWKGLLHAQESRPKMESGVDGRRAHLRENPIRQLCEGDMRKPHTLGN